MCGTHTQLQALHVQGLVGGKMEPVSFLVLQINLAVPVPLWAPFPQIQSPVVFFWTDGNTFESDMTLTFPSHCHESSWGVCARARACVYAYHKIAQ